MRKPAVLNFGMQDRLRMVMLRCGRSGSISATPFGLKRRGMTRRLWSIAYLNKQGPLTSQFVFTRDCTANCRCIFWSISSTPVFYP